MKTMTRLLFIPVFIFFAVFAFYACNKTEDTNSSGNFVWTYNGVTTSTNTDTAYVNNGSLAYLPYTIMAGFPRSSSSPVIKKRVEFNLTSFNAGTYSITSGGSNKMSYVDDAGNDLNGISGTITFTVNAGKMSGNFSCILINAASVTSPLTGNFTGMVIKP